MRHLPRVIFFDAAGTLIHLPRPVGEHYREVALNFGIAPDATALDRAFRQAWKRAPRRTACSGPRPNDDKDWWRELVSAVMQQGLDPIQARALDFDAYFEALYAHFARPGVWAAYPEAPSVLTRLRAAGFRLGVISNFDGRLPTILGHLELAQYFEKVIISSEVGADKPDPAIFSRALEVFDVAAADALHVGDDADKDGGAAAVGLRVFHVQRPVMSLSALADELER